MTNFLSSSTRLLLAVLIAGFLGSTSFAAAPPLRVDSEWLVAMSPEQKVEYSVAALVEMRDGWSALKEIEKSSPTCMMIRLQLVDTLIAVSDVTANEMKKFLANGEDERSNAELRRIAVALVSARTYVTEGRTCSGVTQITYGESKSSVYLGAELQTELDETMSAPVFEYDAAAPPLDASPFI